MVGTLRSAHPTAGSPAFAGDPAASHFKHLS